jgi:protein-S-isoprenylcysteine O-methyltransferase Ste14
VQPFPLKYIYVCWIVVGIVWLIGAFLAKRTARKQSLVTRLSQVAVAVAIFALLYGNKMRLSGLAKRFVPDTAATAWVGLSLTIAGCGLAILARFYLGGNWSGIVTIKQGHTLVRTGPYALVRNPIYSGFLLAALGFAIAAGHFRDLLASIVMLAVFVYKISIEERFMREQFGEQYLQYKRETKALIPYVW